MGLGWGERLLAKSSQFLTKPSQLCVKKELDLSGASYPPFSITSCPARPAMRIFYSNDNIMVGSRLSSACSASLAITLNFLPAPAATQTRHTRWPQLCRVPYWVIRARNPRSPGASPKISHNVHIPVCLLYR